MGMKAVLGRGICSIAAVLTMVQAAPMQEKLYEVPKAMVIYKISGGGALNEDVNLTLDGNGKLRFKEWGGVELVERNITERTTGALHYVGHKEICEKRQQSQILDVDFKNRKIRERPLPKGKEAVNRTAGLVRSGQQMVANIVCTMWEGKGVKKCLYKGIPLFTEYSALGLYYREEAVEVAFDINISNEADCSMPKYPVEKFALYTTNFKTKSKKTPKIFPERLREVITVLKGKSIDEESLQERQKRALLNKLGEPIFEDQKKLLPKFLQTMKKTRACLVQAETTDAANSCLNELVKIKSYFTGNTQNRIDDWEEEREKVLDAFDENIISLQSKMKCIRGAKRMDDLSVCMKQ